MTDNSPKRGVKVGRIRISRKPATTQQEYREAMILAISGLPIEPKKKQALIGKIRISPPSEKSKSVPVTAQKKPTQ